MKDIKRIGERKHYKGNFALVKTDDLLGRYLWPAYVSGEYRGRLADFKPIVPIDGEGIYVGEGRFMYHGDIFKE